MDYEQTETLVRNYFINYPEEEVKVHMNDQDMCEYTKMKYEVCQRTRLPFTSDEEDTSLPFPPICCYDGMKDIEEKTKDMLLKQYQDKINEYKQRLIYSFKYSNISVSRYGEAVCYSFLRREFNDKYNHIEYKTFRKGMFK